MTTKYECDCGRVFTDHSALMACQASGHEPTGWKPAPTKIDDLIPSTPAGRRGQGKAVASVVTGIRCGLDAQDSLEARVGDLVRLGSYLVEAVLLASASLADIADTLTDIRSDRRKI